MKTFGETLKTLRNETGLTGEELGKIFHVTKVAISNWENGNRFPDEDMLKRIADYFNVSLDYLLGRTNNKSNIVVKDTLNGDSIEIEVNKNKFPYGLTHDEVIEIVEAYKKLEQAGFKFVPPAEEQK